MVCAPFARSSLYSSTSTALNRVHSSSSHAISIMSTTNSTPGGTHHVVLDDFPSSILAVLSMIVKAIASTIVFLFCSCSCFVCSYSCCACSNSCFVHSFATHVRFVKRNLGVSYLDSKFQICFIHASGPGQN